MNELLDSSHTNGCWQPLSLTIPLLGLHQVENATTAYAALVIAREEGLTLTDEEIKKGFASVFWPGRFEIMQKEPPVIIDSAHNRDSALKLRLALDDYFPSVPIVLLFGASEDKDIEGMFAELLPRVNRVVATQSIHPRAIEAEMLVALAHKFGCPAKAVLPVEEAFTYALSLAGEKTAVVVSGSLFIAAAARSVWMQMDPARRQSIRYQLKGNDR
ncbi:MAG TPA: cyanophycin synthetase [Anaerolineaceae bacterium]